MLLLIAAVVGSTAYRFVSNSSGDPPHAPGTPESFPRLVKEARRISIPPGSPLRSELPIARIELNEIRRTLELPAVVEADPAATTRVFSPVAGRVIDLKVQVGDRVMQQQELAVIVRSDLAQSQASFERPGTRLRALAAPVDETKETRLLSLKAPVAGSVIDLQMAPGAFLDDTSASIMTIADLGRIWVTMNVPKRDLALFDTGQSVETVLTAYPSEVFKGEAHFISGVLDTDTPGAKARIAFENPDTRLKPNMSAIATLFGPKQTVLIVPRAALIQKERTNEVFVEVAPWTFEARPVDIGFEQGDQAIVTRGLKVGDRVVAKGGALLND